MSSSYERVNYITSFGFSIRWRNQFLKVIPENRSNISVLDLMTGMGEIWHPVKTHFPNCSFTALDFSDCMLEKARIKNQKQFNDSIHIVNQDALNSNLKNESYDVILSAFGLKTFNNSQLEKLAFETKRLLKSGGSFSFIEVSEWYLALAYIENGEDALAKPLLEKKAMVNTKTTITKQEL